MGWQGVPVGFGSWARALSEEAGLGGKGLWDLLEMQGGLPQVFCGRAQDETGALHLGE